MAEPAMMKVMETARGLGRMCGGGREVVRERKEKGESGEV